MMSQRTSSSAPSSKKGGLFHYFTDFNFNRGKLTRSTDRAELLCFSLMSNALNSAVRVTEFTQMTKFKSTRFTFSITVCQIIVLFRLTVSFDSLIPCFMRLTKHRQLCVWLHLVWFFFALFKL